MKEVSITLKEMLPMILACVMWGPEWRKYTVVIHCNNSGAVDIIESGYKKVSYIARLGLSPSL